MEPRNDGAGSGPPCRLGLRGSLNACPRAERNNPAVVKLRRTGTRNRNRETREGLQVVSVGGVAYGQSCCEGDLIVEVGYRSIKGSARRLVLEFSLLEAQKSKGYRKQRQPSSYEKYVFIAAVMRCPPQALRLFVRRGPAWTRRETSNCITLKCYVMRKRFYLLDDCALVRMTISRGVYRRSPEPGPRGSGSAILMLYYNSHRIVSQNRK